MGINFSEIIVTTNLDLDPECIICYGKFEKNNKMHTQCTTCYKYMHIECFDKYFESNTRKHCLCPYCQSVGTLATSPVPGFYQEKKQYKNLFCNEINISTIRHCNDYS